MRVGALLLGLGLAVAGPALAHDGPPYPILVDEVIGGWTVSVWADPDVGVGSFYVYVDAPPGQSPGDVCLEIHSVDGHGIAPPASAVTEPAQAGEPFQLYAEVPFAHRGTWPTRFVLRSATGGAPFGELNYDLEVTPPGLGPFDLVWYAIPFVAIAALWLRRLVAQRAHARGSAPPPSPNTQLP